MPSRKSSWPAAPTPNLISAAAQRVAIVRGFGGSYHATAAETVVATATNLVFAASKEDIILFWATVSVVDIVANGSGVANTLTWRIRANSIGGPILCSGAVTATDGATGKGGLGVNRADATFSEYGIHIPTALGFRSFVLTIQNSEATNPNINITTATANGSLMVAAKSA